MRRLLFLFAILFLWGCNNDSPRQQEVKYVIILDGISYNLTEEAYDNLSVYLEFLSTYYVDESDSEQIVSEIKALISDEFDKKIKNENDVITQDDIEKAIQEIKETAYFGTSSLPGLEEVNYAPLTVMAYLVANNNLDDDLLANIGAIYDGLAQMSKPAVALIYWDGQTSIGINNSKHLILRYETDGSGNINGVPALDLDNSLDVVLEQGEIVKEYTSQLSTDKKVMSQVLEDMISISPTSKFGLIVGSHASSWLNSIYTSRAFGQDGSGTDNTILIPDMVDALKATNKTFEFILFDACYMATAEVSYMFRDVAKYQIASVMEVPAYGFPYEVFMKDLYAGTASSYQNVCQSYIDYYQELYRNGSYAWGTVTLIDSKEISNLTDLLKQEITSHKDVLADYDTSHLQEYGKSSGPYIAVDLGHLIKDLNDDVLPASFSTQLEKTVLYKGCLENASPSNYAVKAANYSGLGIYVPVENRPNWNQYFKTLDWYTAAGWNEVDFSWDF